MNSEFSFWFKWGLDVHIGGWRSGVLLLVLGINVAIKWIRREGVEVKVNWVVLPCPVRSLTRDQVGVKKSTKSGWV